ncbi:E3 ubiquitin-protein ligase ZNF598 [Bombus vosnesenskii]|uniref:RING-type E3 ubiquitin transferase n=1 Tax=Bombus vosnesenskii TaxID=207650 RepID=A0A6J3JWU5_9HYME|nr:E3 ubiquitin-protein ligase ZNF598 [Bombus vosnesenskii]XP_050471249.1 E3 ubiquitin-protein ligase ZNF598 isoform X1 [Bombus huntii]XP_050471250.1 E3 ubiquitin-protein ligase ZNF598 isoform X1 [Bombus huntii]
MSANNESMNNNTCVVCYKNVDIYSIGMCEHPVCYECSTRMRVLCCQNECPICRQDLPKVVFTKEIKPFNQLHKGNLLDTRYNIYFDTLDIQSKFYDLLANVCYICKERPVFSTFNSLKDHMRHQHELHYCDLCVENLKIFSHERRCYTRSDLAQHRRKGDIDDKSHKGHPLCEFCDQRYMDNDELFRHLRRDHLYCHFCDADGLHQYYSSYDYLRDHFRQEHFLCEEGMCAEEKFTSVFRTDIDLKAHKASVHSKQLSKAAAKQARMLELEFTLAPRGENRMNRRGMLGPSTSRNSRDYSGRDYNLREYQQTVTPNTSNVFMSNNEPAFVQQPSVDVQSTEEFPTLGNTAPIVPTLNQSKGRGNVTIRSTIRPQPLAVTDENFPALGPESGSTSISKTVNFSVSSSNASGLSTQSQKSTTSNVSIQVNHEPNGTVTTKVSGPNIRIRPAQFSMESFPALGSAEPSTSSNTNLAHWKEVLQWTCSKSASTSAPKPKKVASPPLIPSPPPIQSGEDFPTLSKSSKSKKQSTITVVPSWSQAQSSNNSNNAKTTTDITKGKTKKKKVKQNCNNNTANGNDGSSSKTNVSTAVVKKECETPTSSPITNKTHAGQSSSQSILKYADITNSENTSKNINVQPLKEIEQINKKEKKKHKNADNEAVVNTDIDNNATNGVQRKRTELKIDSLNSTNRNTRHLEDFPALSGSSSKPPGFTNPPPGFGTTTPPPPGFCIKYNSMDKINNSNGLTFTNSSGESYSILPDNSKHDSAYNYVHPPEFQKRNKCLVAKVNEVLMQHDQIEEFRYISGLFRQGTCNAQDYYMHCREVMGLSAFENVFSELLVLLPDIEKQQELFKVHQKESGNKIKGLEICATCGQVLKNGSDFRTHMTSHTLENHFPALGKNNVLPQKNSWVRK